MSGYMFELIQYIDVPTQGSLGILGLDLVSIPQIFAQFSVQSQVFWETKQPDFHDYARAHCTFQQKVNSLENAKIEKANVCITNLSWQIFASDET